MEAENNLPIVPASLPNSNSNSGVEPSSELRDHVASAPVIEEKKSDPVVIKAQIKEVELSNVESWTQFEVPTNSSTNVTSDKQQVWSQYQNMSQQKNK